MIACITGTLSHADERFIVINVGGIGYKVRITAETLATLRKDPDAPVSLWTHLAVREDALDLYGFETQDELELFELLISVSGIGPKSALGILNVAPGHHLRDAIIDGDTATLTKVSGIGAKGAQKIILELRDKLGDLEIANPKKKSGSSLRDEQDAIEALSALGYSERDARKALKSVSSDVVGTPARIKAALKHLSA